MIKNKRDNPINRRGQVTIFIIIAILIITGVIAYLILREGSSSVSLPVSIQPVYSTFLSCVEEQARIGITILETQGGYIDIPELEIGSEYMPFSSQLNFLGNNLPYWYYVSGNNIQKEQVPTEQEMERSLADFVNYRISSCDFDNYYKEGFEINFGESKTIVDIKEQGVFLNINFDLSITKGNDTSLISNHNLEIDSNFYSLYNSALEIYEKEQNEFFLEKYGIDVLRLYAPVDGFELSCAPLIWNAEEVFDNLRNAIEANTLALSSEEFTSSERKYFYVQTSSSNSVRFITSREWPNSIEVLPSEGVSLIAKPVGTQEGMGLLGFCYVPYHFVYNINYPVLVQIYNGDEIFQFPLAVVIQGNQPRKSLDTLAFRSNNKLCDNMNSLTSVKIYDSDLNPVDAQISYTCLGTTCDIGKTSSGVLESDFPQCVNGYILVKAEGYRDKKYLYSSVDESSANIIIHKLYDLSIDLNIATPYDSAIIYFKSDEDSEVVYYPLQKKVNLSEGDYEISVYAYTNSSIQFQEITEEQCIDVADSGLGGVLGFTEERCFDITIPAQVINNVLSGGGKKNISISEDILKISDLIEISADSFKVPTKLEHLQENYLAFESSKLEVNVK